MSTTTRCILGKFVHGPGDGSEMDVYPSTSYPEIAVVYRAVDSAQEHLYQGSWDGISDAVQLHHIGPITQIRSDDASA